MRVSASARRVSPWVSPHPEKSHSTCCCAWRKRRVRKRPVPHAALAAHIKPADAALATEITLGVLRWRRLLDFLLERHLKKPSSRLDLPVILALRMGLYQLRFLDKIPARAAINELSNW